MSFDLTKAPVDVYEYPFCVKAGDHKIGDTEKCTGCQRPPLDAPLEDGSVMQVFAFRDRLSAKEYTLSGMCQECQDAFFVDEAG